MAQKRPIKTPVQLENDQLRLDLHQRWLDLQASDRRIARLMKRIDELQSSNKEQILKGQLHDTQKRLLDAQIACQEFRKKIEEKKESDLMAERLNKQEREAFVTKIKELTLKLDVAAEEKKKWLKQLSTFQQELMTSLGVTDDDLSRNVLNGGIGESSKTCGPTKLHSFLCTTMENLRAEYTGMVRECTHLRSIYGEEVLKASVFENEAEVLKSERKRHLEIGREHESQIQYLSSEIKLLRSFLTDEMVKEAEEEMKTLHKDNRTLRDTLVMMKQEFDGKVAELNHTIKEERDKYDKLRREGIQGRKDLDSTWRKLWEEHSKRMKEELETLRVNLESPLKSSRSREVSLQQQLYEVQERYNRSKESWEEYRKGLLDQLDGWKEQYIHKCTYANALEQQKQEFDAVLDEKQKDLEMYQNMIKDGVIERQNLQEKVNELEVKLRSVHIPGNNGAARAHIRISPSWYSMGDFEKMQARMQKRPYNNNEDEVKSSPV